MRIRCGALFSRQGSSLQWRGEGTARAIARQQAPRPTTPPSNLALRECLAALAHAPDTATQRRALADIQQCVSSARKEEEKTNVYQYLGPLDLGLILRRAVTIGDWGIAEHVLAHGGDKISFPTAAMAEAALLCCCREGKPEVAQTILLKLLATNSAPQLSTSPFLSRSTSLSLYTVILRALGKSGHWKGCVELLRHPKLAPFLVIDEACVEAGITACGRQGCVEEAMGLYDDFRSQHQQRLAPFVSASCHNAAIRACARSGSLARAHDIIHDAQQDEVLPSLAAFNVLLLTCGRLGAWDVGSKVLADMKALGVQPNEVSYAGAVQACVKPKQWKAAVALLREMKDRGIFPDELCYAATIEVCCRGGQWHRVGQLLDGMQAKGLEVSEDLFLLKILPALSKAGRWRESRDTLARMRRQGVKVQLEAHRLALLACRRSGQWQKALEALQELRRVGPAPSLACYEIVLESCAQGGRWVEGNELFKEMQRVDHVVPSVICYRAMLELCGKVGRWGEAMRLWKEVEARVRVDDGEEGREEDIERGKIQHGLLIGCFQGALMACQQASRGAEALALLQQQETEHKKGKSKMRLLASMTSETRTQSYALVLGACSKVGEWGLALDLLRRTPLPDEACFEAVLEACARAGRWREALTTLRALEQRVERGEGLVLEARSYQLAMWACTQAGRAQEAVDLMEEMTEFKGLVPTARAYVTYLKALQRLGRWEEALRGLEEAKRNNVLLLGRGQGRKSSGSRNQELLALTTVLQTLSRAGRWREVLALMVCESEREEEGEERGLGGGEALPYSGVSWTLVDVLLAEGRAQEAVLFVEGLAKEAGVAPGLPLVNRLLEGLAKGGEWALCQELLLGENEIESNNSTSTSTSSSSTKSSSTSTTSTTTTYSSRSNSNITINSKSGSGCGSSSSSSSSSNNNSSSSSSSSSGNSMKARFHTVPDVASFSVVMSAAAAGVAAGTNHASSAAQELTKLLPMMRTRHGLKPDVIAYNVTANLHRRSGDWEKVLVLLEEMKEEAAAATAAADSDLSSSREGLAPDVVTYSTAIAACGEAGKWEKVLELLAEMPSMGVSPNVVAYTAAVAACGRGGQPERALGLLREMKSEGISPNVQCYNTLLWALAKGGDWQQCLALLEEMKEEGKTDAHSYRIVMGVVKSKQGQEHVMEALQADMEGSRTEAANDSFGCR